MIYRILIAALLLGDFSSGIQLSCAQAAQLKEGWKQDIEIPEVKDKDGNVLYRGATVKLWVEQGWLVARREQPNGYWDWQIVLAQATDPNPPETKLLGGSGSIEINYNRYFIREAAGRMRVLRECKTNDSPAWPGVPLPIATQVNGHMGNHGFQVSNGLSGDWRWYASGFDKQNDIWVRMNHRMLVKSFGVKRVSTMVIGLFGDYTTQDEGDLFVGQRQVADDEQLKEILEKQSHAESKNDVQLPSKPNR
jgi:hypothetical protein